MSLPSEHCLAGGGAGLWSISQEVVGDHVRFMESRAWWFVGNEILDRYEVGSRGEPPHKPGAEVDKAEVVGRGDLRAAGVVKP